MRGSNLQAYKFVMPHDNSMLYMYRYAQEKDSYGDLQDFPALAVALESKVIAERETLFTQLKELTNELVCSPDHTRSTIFIIAVFISSVDSLRLLKEWECCHVISKQCLNLH